ncbi:MotA/TolQ/ExbB proton channel family protein [Oceanicoccus sp. KOV_DT_Chl]|uniref:MotA/TolQ/ExbB proton channel family protein n=1 Tax=Oceanicoccus sp. KOV_DT_Chl TaxID=1904639 RepID=UPI000C7C1497|nr:MotA/TolQ/ExbB proton channel family protein [Oceanicoccus sp. KOV_DT_Chl]
MTYYLSLQQQLGYLAIPLLLCSLITLALLLEKMLVLALASYRKQLVDQQAPVFAGKNQPLLVARGLNFLTAHRSEKKSLREDVAEIWLGSQRQQLSSGIRLLQVIALLTPLLGLLGTVLGLIQVFESLADHHGPIEPSLLADGLGLAMYTTAVGLIIALPALAGAHGFQIWVDKIIHRTELSMNMMNLLIDGIELGAGHD